eukprot:TRINITY_DN30706_c0_g1_i1.p1 TRINITY_DN30706_c0_g1~~TRINITY_DN30706_c0_g1_i1.p1  ORF type:complete len:619 (+),score=102.79 TRINITY_DN30706_c0_g1_i1:136-1992(+)
MSRSNSRRRSPRRSGSPTKVHSRSRSGAKRSRSQSRLASESRPADYGVDTMKISDSDAAFILGKGGKTKEKIANVSQAEIELFERDLVLEIRGSQLQRRRAKKYCEGVMAQRIGPVSVDDSYDDGDLTMLNVPQSAVGFVTGRGGNFLRSIEEQWTTIMFFCEVEKGRGREKEFEKLAIFGSLRARRGAELLVLSAVESKVSGYYDKVRDDVLDRDRGKDETGTWDTDTMEFKDEELSYALGKQGGTRKKLERASGCVIQYVRKTALLSGDSATRKRGKEYINFLFKQLDGPVWVDDWEKRDDITVVDIPVECIGYVTGSRRAALGSMEEEWGTLMFFMTKPGANNGKDRGSGRGKGYGEQLAILGDDRARQGAALKVMSTVEEKVKGQFTRDVREKFSSEKGFATDQFFLKDDELSYALGRQGSTRRKLALASGCIIQYVGHICYLAGTLPERKRAKEFLDWLLSQRRGSITIGDTSHRKDVTEVSIPDSCKRWITGNGGSAMRRIEADTKTFMFMAKDKNGDERLLIFAVEQGSKGSKQGRLAAERMVDDAIQDKLRGRRSDSRSPSRRDSRSRSPSRRGRRTDSRRRYCSRSRSPRRRRSPTPRQRGRSDSRRRR